MTVQLAKKMTYEQLEQAYIQLQHRLQVEQENNELRQNVIVFLEQELAQLKAK